MYISAQNGHLEVVRLLLNHGAALNRQTGEECTAPLYVAAQNGHTAVVKALLEQRAEPDL